MFFARTTVSPRKWTISAPIRCGLGLLGRRRNISGYGGDQCRCCDFCGPSGLTGSETRSHTATPVPQRPGPTCLLVWRRVFDPEGSYYNALPIVHSSHAHVLLSSTR